MIWEVKTTTTGIHNKDNTYEWGGISAIGLGHPDAEGTYYNDWDELVNGSNVSNGLCGFTNWRVPTVDEIFGLVNQGIFYPALDRNYFPNTTSSRFWSSSPFVNWNRAAWYVDFDNGYPVRLVRSLDQ